MSGRLDTYAWVPQEQPGGTAVFVDHCKQDCTVLSNSPAVVAAIAPSFTPPLELITAVDRLCDQGRFLAALALAESSGDWRQWRGCDAELAAARLMNHLGAARASEACSYHIFRRYRSEPAAQLRYLRAIMNRRGPYLCWQRFQELPIPDITSNQRAEWLALRASLSSHLRDFTGAMRDLDEAESLQPENPWIWIERAHVYEQMDRYDAALTAANQALKLERSFRAGFQQVAHLYVLTDQAKKAQLMLQAICPRLESASLWRQLAELQVQAGHYAEADQSLDRALALLPMAEPVVRDNLIGRRVDIACYRGDRAQALAMTESLQDPFYRQLHERLQQPDFASKRVLLDVPYVRQHHMTCAPATLAALSQYWRLPALHLDISEQICYDGTPHHSERNWAERNGWFAREFTVDWDSAVALLDRGIPFTLTTVHQQGSHLQAVIGYDKVRGTLILRDPSHSTHTELIAEVFFATHRASGPRGMVLVPVAEQQRLADLSLPDAPIWDCYYRLHAALDRHHREEAVTVAAELAAKAPEHRLRWHSQRSLALYDGDEAGALAATEALLQQSPGDSWLVLAKTHSLGIVAGRNAQLDWLRQHAVAREPTLRIRYAQMLGGDHRTLKEAADHLRGALRRLPTHGHAWYALAGVHWESGERNAALAHYHIAACLLDTDEQAVTSYFRAAQHFGQTESVLALLRERVDRLGSRSSQPALTLFRQLDQLERVREGFAVLEAALERRPDDGDLLLAAAEAFMRYGQAERAEALLHHAKRHAKPSAWLFLQAQLRANEGHSQQALTSLRIALEQEPLHIGMHRLMARLLAQTEGRSAVLNYLRERCTALPHYIALHELWLEWLQTEPLPDYEAGVRQILATHPQHAWALRELAVNLARQRRHDEAEATVAEALQIEPYNSFNYSTQASIILMCGDPQRALVALKRAVTLSVDNEYAIERLLTCASDLKERIEALHFIADQLQRQPVFGNGLLALQDAALGRLPAEQVLPVLQRLRNDRPELWQAWIAESSQLLSMGTADQALALLEQAAERFPLLPRLRLEQALAMQLLGQHAEARQMLERALTVSPGWSRAARLYTESLLEHGGDLMPAKALLERALLHNPYDADMCVLLAIVMAKLGEDDKALAILEQTLRHEPENHWPWQVLKRQSVKCNQPQRARELAQQLLAERPASAALWCRLAELQQELNEQLDAFAEACRFAPFWSYPWEQRLLRLLDAGRLDEAEAILAQLPWSTPPVELEQFRARLCRQRGKRKSARALLDTLLEREPTHFGL